MGKILFSVLVAFLLLLPLESYGRTYKATFDKATPAAVMSTLSQETGLEFVYDPSVIKGNAYGPVTCSYSDLTLDQLLNRIICGQMRLLYKIDGKTVTISRPSATEVFNGTISGRVMEHDENAPLPGATVTIDGTRHATVTDIDGNFRFNGISAVNPVVTVSFIGMKPESAKVTEKNHSSLNFNLVSATTMFDEVVVTGYQTLSKERATGSFDIIDSKQLEKATPNIATRLLGASAGLAGTQDINGTPTFEIRGTSSFSVSSAPLLVVDGFAIEGGFESINPNDVESITVLKDAAAASIWGAKSANGVIVITTKGGKGSGDKNTKVDVNYSGFYKISPKMDLDYALSRASADEQIDYEMATFNKWGADTWYPEEMSEYAGGSSVYELLNAHRLGHITEQEMLAGINRYRGIDNTDQIRKHILQNPMTLQQNVGVNIQTERSNTALSVLYQNKHDNWKGNADDKYMVSLNNRTSIYKWVDFVFNGMFDYTDQKLDGRGGFPDLMNYENLIDENGNPIRYSSVSQYFLKNYVPMEQFPYQDWTWDAFDNMNNRDRKATRLNARAQAGLTFKIWKGLTYDARVQYELLDTHYDTYYNEDSYTVRDLLNSTCTWDRNTNAVTRNLPLGGFLDRSRSKLSVLTIRNQVNFNQTFGQHSIAVIGGLETTDRHAQTFGYPRTYGYNANTLTVGTLPGKGTFTNWTSGTVNIYSTSYNGVSTFTDNTDRYFSAFANASYTFDNKYTVSGSYRTDASNLITDDPSYRYAPFWSVGAGWQLGKEKWMQEFTWLDRLNVRFTYGYNGNVDKSTTFKPLLTTSASPNVITDQYTGNIASYGNPTLRWEKTGTWDFGVDYNLFGSKLYGKIDVYRKLSEDLIAAREISAVNGTTSMRLNNGKIQNSGFEIEVGSAINITPNISWNGTLRLSYNKNKVKSLKVAQHYGYQLVGGGSGAWVEGEDMNTLWCFEYAGVINDGTESSPHYAPSVYYENGERVGFTTYLYGDGTSYCLNMGTKVAPWHVSLGSTFRFWDFDFSFLMTAKLGHKFMRESFNYPAPTGGRSPLNSKYSEIANCDPAVRCPLPMQDREDRFYFWDRFYPYLSYLSADASHIRMQEISLAYNLPKHLAAKLGMKHAQVSVMANNPFNIYFNGWNEDPEFGKGSPKLQSSYTIGLKLNF